MGQFQFEKRKEGSKILIQLKGPIDEDATLGNIDLEGAQELSLDLSQVQAINSCGIREWIKWFKAQQGVSKIIFKNCPKIIVDQINMVAGFLPPQGLVESFYVPYFSEDSGNEKMVLFSRGKEFNETEVHPPPEVKGPSGELMEMDVIETKYFKFIKNKG